MDTAARTTVADRLGRTLGRAVRACVRLNRRAHRWLVLGGCSPDVAKRLVTIAGLLAIAVLLYVAMWIALAILFAVVCAWVASNDDGSHDEEQRPEWRYGAAGYGLYTPQEQRIDPHDPKDEQA